MSCLAMKTIHRQRLRMYGDLLNEPRGISIMDEKCRAANATRLLFGTDSMCNEDTGEELASFPKTNDICPGRFLIAGNAG